MQFNGVSFKFGEIEITVGAMNTETGTGSIEVTVPVSKGEVSVKLMRTKGWMGEMVSSVNVRFDDETNKRKPEPEPEDENEGVDWDTEEDRD